MKQEHINSMRAILEQIKDDVNDCLIDGDLEKLYERMVANADDIDTLFNRIS